MEKVCHGDGEDHQFPLKKKRGRPRKSDQVVRVLKEKKDGSVKEKKELRQRSYEDNVSKFMEYSGSNSDKQLFMKGNEKQKESDGERGVMEKTSLKQGVGDYVDGVIDGAFDAGYLVTIKIGSDSNRLYHGVVFGPELSTPINQQNDVVPQLKMITYASQETSGYGYGLV